MSAKGRVQLWQMVSLALVTTVLATGCAPAPPTAGTTAASQPAQLGNAAAGAATAASGTAEWEQAVAAARREGKLVIAGPPGATYRAATLGFQQQYPDIQIEYTGLSGRDIGPRFLMERQADQKLWDVHVGGSNTMHTVLIPGGVLADIRPALLLPEVKDDANWYGGFDFGFTDTAKKYAYAFVANVTPPIHVNRSIVSESQFSSPRQLLEPRFKGKIIMEDPRAAGAGARQLAALMSAYGEDFGRKLLTEQDIVYTRDLRQLVEGVVRGRYPIGIGSVTGGTLQEFLEQGLGKDIESIKAPEVEVWTAGFGAVALVEGGPHPSAAKVFINWLLTRSTQESWAKTTGDNSRRRDVSVANPETFPNPDQLQQYIRNDEAWEVTREKAVELAERIIR